MIAQISPDSQVGRANEVLQSQTQHRAGETLDAGHQRSSEEDVAFETLDLLKRGVLNIEQSDLESLEAIVHERGRPVVDIVNDRLRLTDLSQLWRHLGEGSIRPRIEASIPSIGRIEIPNDPLGRPYAGTGFLAGDGLLVTNRHVAMTFASGLGVNELRFISGHEKSVGVDLKREIGSEESEPFIVHKVVMIHPYWDMAILEVPHLKAPSGKALTLSTAHPDELVGEEQRDVVVIGYPAIDQRNGIALQMRVFRGVFNVKRLQPGKLKRRKEVVSFGRTVNAITHDCSTLGGNSGSAVIDVATGHVIGLHFGGDYLLANYAVPVYELAADSRVIDAGLAFDGQVLPSDVYPAAWRLVPDAVVQHPNEFIDPGPMLSCRRANDTETQVAFASSMPSGLSVATGSRTSVRIPITIEISVDKPQISHIREGSDSLLKTVSSAEG
jgi:S1-C subfamily serine protease